jgi:hypothetical protein
MAELRYARSVAGSSPSHLKSPCLRKWVTHQPKLPQTSRPISDDGARTTIGRSNRA